MSDKIIKITVLIFAVIITVGYLLITKQFTDASLTLYGNVDIRTVNVSFRSAGRLAALNVDEGDYVEAGQLLGQLDDQPYQIVLQQSRANVEAVEAKADLIKSGFRSEEIAQVRSSLNQATAASAYATSYYQRQELLWNEKLISDNDLDNAKNQHRQALAALNVAKEKLAQYTKGYRQQEIQEAVANLQQVEAVMAQAELNLADCRLYSPASGTILTRAVEPGTMLAAGSTVFTLSLNRPVWVRAYVSEMDLSQAVYGTIVNIYRDGQSTPYQGKIGFVSPTAEFTPKNVETPDLRTSLVYRLRITVINPDDALRQGMPVTIKFAP